MIKKSEKNGSRREIKIGKSGKGKGEPRKEPTSSTHSKRGLKREWDGEIDQTKGSKIAKTWNGTLATHKTKKTKERKDTSRATQQVRKNGKVARQVS